MADEPTIDVRLPEQEPASEQQPQGAMRSWLVSGVQFVDRRRRFGAHGRARELLVVDRPVAPGVSQRWAAALHRYAVRSGLSELSPEQRRVITMAYLEGRTNEEIATALGVSITTVRRRLWVALGRLDAYLRGSGAWLSALLLAAAIYALNHSTRFVRWVPTAVGSAEKAQRLAATATAGALAATALGIVAFTSDTPMPSKSSPGATQPSIVQTVFAEGPSTPVVPRAVAPSPAQPNSAAHRVTGANAGARSVPTTASRPPAIDCDGNRTDAPPHIPVGPRANHPTEPPVTHSDEGDCD
jgi:RNA polymerase sigma factor (sigma-70 family)